MRQSSTPRVCCVVVRALFLQIKPRIRRRRSALSDCSIRISCLPDTAVITVVVVGGGGAAAAMSNPSGIVKRIPLIKFPNRKAGQTQGRPQGGAKGASLLSGGSASTQPPRTKVSKEEIEMILLGGATA